MTDPLKEACNDRDDLRRRVLHIADALGIRTGEASGDVQAQWLELCDRIDAKLARRGVINVTP